MEQELLNVSLSVLQSTLEGLGQQHDTNVLSTAITNIDRLSDLIEEFINELPPVWYQALNLLETATQKLLVAITEMDAVPQSRGRPKINIEIASIEYLLSLKFNVRKIAKMHGVSEDTIHRRLRENHLSVSISYSQMKDEDLESKIFNILQEFPNTGYKRMKGFLLQAGIKCTDARVRTLIRTVDPDGVFQRLRQNRAIVRRQYFVTYSNEMWHLDTNMKLNRWKIIIRGCVDGKSRTVIYLKASADNRADTNLLAFMEGVSEYGTPLRTRSDKGRENMLIAKFMLETRGINRGSHICGRSVHNQRIERYWRDVTTGCTGFYKNVFHTIENEQVLNIENETHIYLLHQIFLPRLNKHLTNLMNAWNYHPLSTESNQTPRQIMLGNLFPRNWDLELTQDDRLGIETLCNDYDDLNQFDEQDDELRFPEPINPTLSNNLLAYLATMDPLADSNDYGVDIFRDALQHA